MFYSGGRGVTIGPIVSNYSDIFCDNERGSNFLWENDGYGQFNDIAKEVEILSGGPHLHVIKRVSDLKGLPLNMLKAIEIQLRKDLQEVDKVGQMLYNQSFRNNVSSL